MKTVDFSKSFVKSGVKAKSEAYAQLTLTSTYNGFKLNNKAVSLLGITPGTGRVVMFDNYEEGVPMEERFLIAAGFTDAEGVEQGALVSKLKTFNYSRIYGSMLLGKEDVELCSKQDLIDAGKLVDASAGIATEMITMELVPYQDEPVEIAEGVTTMVYKLVNWTRKEHNPKTGNEEAESVTEEVTVED